MSLVQIIVEMVVIDSDFDLYYNSCHCQRVNKNSSEDTYRTWHRSILLPLMRLTPPTEGFPWDDLRKILHKGKRMAKVQNGEEILPKFSTFWVRRTNVTDDRRICDSKDPNSHV